MNCNNCGKPTDNESNFCKYCGTNLKEITDTALNPHQTIFGSQYQPKTNTDLGYLIIAFIIIINIFIWFFWGLIFSTIESSNEIFYIAIRVISLLFSIAQFVVMFIFTKRRSYQIVIGIIAGLVILYNLYILIDWYNRFGS
jgi:Double zinc ribbon